MLVTYCQEEDPSSLNCKLDDAADWADLAVVGPGIGKSDTALSILEAFLEKDTSQPLVIDADGLNLLAEHPEILKDCVRPYILTPHMGEMARLSGYTISQLKSETRKCLTKLREQLKNYTDAKPVLVLKDARTMTMTDDNKFYLNLSGNSGMATAGSGDVL